MTHRDHKCNIYSEKLNSLRQSEFQPNLVTFEFTQNSEVNRHAVNSHSTNLRENTQNIITADITFAQSESRYYCTPSVNGWQLDKFKCKNFSIFILNYKKKLSNHTDKNWKHPSAHYNVQAHILIFAAVLEFIRFQFIILWDSASDADKKN